MALTDQIAALATRIGQEIKALRAEPRTPTAHASTHATGGGDAITPASIGASTSGHSHPSYVSTSRTIATTAPLTGGGDLTANRTLGISVGTTAGTVAAGDHVHSAAAITSGTLSADRLPAVLSPVRTQAFSATPTIDPTVAGSNVSITATGNITALGVSTTGATNRQSLEVAVLASGGARTVTFPSAIRTSTGITRGPYSIPSGEVGVFLVKYYSLVGAWVLVAATISAT